MSCSVCLSPFATSSLLQFLYVIVVQLTDVLCRVCLIVITNNDHRQLIIDMFIYVANPMTKTPFICAVCLLSSVSGCRVCHR